MNNLFKALFKKRYKIIQASDIETRDVSKGYEHRDFKHQKIVRIGKKHMIYSQNLIIKRKGVVKMIKVFVNHRLKKTKDGVELILKPKKVGKRIWLE